MNEDVSVFSGWIRSGFMQGIGEVPDNGDQAVDRVADGKPSPLR